MTEENEWDIIIKPKTKLLSFGLNDIWAYRDLIILFVKRDIIAQYKQTILGPLWLVIQPVLSTIFFTIIFGTFAKFETGGIPYPIFTLSGLTIWNFFASSFTKTSNVFVSNASIFGKVYFPRLTVPLSSLIANFITFFVQLFILIALLVYYSIVYNYQWQMNWGAFFLLPFLLLATGLFGMGLGIIASSLTTKYRDLTFLMGFILQFVMYFSSVVFPINNFGEKLKFLFNLNPLIHFVDLFRSIFINSPAPEPIWLLYSTGFVIVSLIFGTLIFSKVEKTFMDTV